MKKGVWVVVIIVALIITFTLIGGGSSRADLTPLKEYEGETIVYKSESCSCCGLYIKHLEGAGKLDVDTTNMADFSAIKRDLGIPTNLESCHTTKIGGYFVEGHIPLEAVSKLLKEQPNIAGIAMPGMPSGSPGMPGQKTGDFVIYAVDFDGNYEEFMRI